MPEVDFSETRRILETFSRGRNRPFLIEALSRLEQLDWLVGQIALAESRALDAHHARVQSDETSNLDPTVVGLQTLVEAFYYLAWRLISLLDRAGGPVPELIGLRKNCRGIRIVRNQLLEHPEGKDSEIHVPAIMFGTSKGPQMKFIAEVKTGADGRPMFRTNKAELFDEGLWVNAHELKVAIETKLRCNNDAQLS